MAPRVIELEEPDFPCRHCHEPVSQSFVDLGTTPLCQTQISVSEFNKPESFFPLQAYVCTGCFLVQLRDCISSEDVFTEDYPYFSSYSSGWVQHAKTYVDEIVKQLELSTQSLVMEIASNDGYLLQHFRPHGIQTLGVEPSRSVAERAIALGIVTEVVFFGENTAKQLRDKYGKADLIVGNNVLAHVPDINDFVVGLKTVLGERGTITMEFPHLLNLIRHNQFDTIYHEHFSYLSLHAVRTIFRAVGLEIVDVKNLHTHGGSLRIFARHAKESEPIHERVAALLTEESNAGLLDPATYSEFGERARSTKRNILGFLLEACRADKRIAGYGAPGKGNTLLNYCGIGTDLIEFTVDANPAKQFTFTPGSRIPIYPPEHIREAKPDFLFILPWNLKDEIMQQTEFIRDWGGKWVTPIPELRVWDDIP